MSQSGTILPPLVYSQRETWTASRFTPHRVEVARQGSGSHRIRGHSKGHHAMVMRDTLIKINISTRHGGPRGGAAYRGHFCKLPGLFPKAKPSGTAARTVVG